jgi:ABC-type dipeptide/oligopeptide/nickel transport system permease component
VLSYLIRRIVFAILLVFSVSSGAMLLTRLAPGDYAVGEGGIGGRQEDIEKRRALYGLDQPMLQQYRRWLVGAVRFDFGQSLAYGRPVSDLIPGRAVNTATLAGVSLLLATVIGVPLGVMTGGRRGGWLVELIRATSIVLLSMPPFLTSLFFVFLAALTGWLPVGGMGTARHLVVPAAALGLPIAAMFERLQSQAVREVVDQPYVLAALARGVPRSRILWRDGLKAALRPLASVYGLVVATLLSGSFAVEWVTSWPGLGRLLLEALRARDVFLVAGCAATGSLLLACGTLLSDVALAIVDPRARD